MRSARPFIASIPVALVLVTAVLVALRVTTGAFGFDAWPTSSGTAAAPLPIAVQVPVAPQRATTVAVPLRSTHAGARAVTHVVGAPARTAPRPTPVASPQPHAPAPAVVRTTPVKPAPAAPAPAPIAAPEHAAAPAPTPEQASAQAPTQPPLHDAAAVTSPQPR